MKKAVLTLLAGLALAGCQDSPDRLTAPDAANGARTSQADYGYSGDVTVTCVPVVEVGLTGYCSASVANSSYVGDVSWSITTYGVLQFSSIMGSGAHVEGIAPGTTSVRAEYNGRSGSANVEVVPRRTLQSIVLTPNPVGIRLGGSEKVNATLYSTNGEYMSRPLAWSMDDPSIATVDANGVVTPHAVGTTTVRATAEGVTGTAQVAVSHNLRITAPTYAYHQNVTATATPLPAGSYHYTWSTRRCTVGGTCEDVYSPVTAGQDRTTFTAFVSRHDVALWLRAEIRAYAGGPVLAWNWARVEGAAEPLPVTTPGSCSPRLFC